MPDNRLMADVRHVVRTGRRELIAEFIGTALLVFCGVGVATASFGIGLAGNAVAAGVVATALAFGLVMLILAYALGPISGCHINPAVTLGFLMARRISIQEAIGYWIAQILGGIVGALILWGVIGASQGYSRSDNGLGANGFGGQSIVGLNSGGALGVEIVLTGLFVFIVLNVTRSGAAPQIAGVAIGLALATVHLVGVPLTGTSVNPARSIGPALIAAGPALSQLWVFIIAPLIGGALAAALHTYLYPTVPGEQPARVDVAEAAQPYPTAGSAAQPLRPQSFTGPQGPESSDPPHVR
jgi:aquaporin Z